MDAQQQAAKDRGELSALLHRLSVGEPEEIGDDTFVPLLLEGDGPDADLLEEGLAAGVTSVDEVNEAGEVSRVRLRHEGTRHLLLVDGEQILGAKQNRTFNASFIVAPGSKIDIPVSCVEKGRWQRRSRRFRSGDTTITTMSRIRKLHRVSQSLAAGAGYDAQQQDVWRDVDEYLERTHTTSRTSSLEDGIAAQRESVKQRLAKLAPEPGQVGLALVRDGKVALMDLFGSESLYARGYRKIVRGMLADARSSGAPTPDAASVVRQAIVRLAEAEPARRAAPGCGETIHGEHDGLVFSAVAFEGKAYHAVVSAK